MGSGMYNLVFGNTELKYPIIDAVLGEGFNVGRYRDLFIEECEREGELVLAVYTRNGGGNRPDYERQITKMQNHPLYIEDADDKYDSTYATFRFRIVLSDYAKDGAMFTAMAEPRVDMDERWKAAIAAFGGNAGE